ncbi:MAG: transcriptional regulator MntR [Phycisphaerae bacterium]|nr:transcriptional regulator MntR [Phycisphaerae bacterium]
MDTNPQDPHSVKRAIHHDRVRKDHAQETAQDYVEAIAELTYENGVARVGALADYFGVSHVTVSKTISRLQRDGLVITRKWHPVELTEAGLKLARQSKKRHEIVLAFLRSLGIDEETAQHDAEGIEHHVSPKTLEVFSRLTRERGGRD